MDLAFEVKNGHCPVRYKNVEAIAREWDILAPERDLQLRYGKDLSFKHILVPTVGELVSDLDLQSTLDVGCGTGILSGILASRCSQVVGVDISRTSIEIARARLQKEAALSEPCLGNGHLLKKLVRCTEKLESRNPQFVNQSVQAFASQAGDRQFTLAVANMVLMDALDLRGVLRAIAKLLADGGALVFTITHPWFWPLYKGYHTAPWFEYRQEIPIEAPFDISLSRNEYTRTTHVHRPLERYIGEFQKAGFALDTLREPMPSDEVENLYPEKWQFPRFLAGRCLKRDSL